MSLINFPDKINSPELLAYFQQFGTNQYVTAEELNQFRDAINFLGESINTNGFIEKKTHGFSGNNYLIASFFKWMINLESYSNTASLTLNIPFSATGKTRGEVIVATTDNTFIRLIAAESSTVTAFPDVPVDTIELARYIVRDNSIDNPTEPVPVGNFVEKEYYTAQHYTGSGVVGTINMDQKRAQLVINGTVSKLGGVQKNTQNYIIGQLFLLRNNTAGYLEVEDLAGPPNVKFSFPDGKNFFLPPKHIAPFVFAYEDGIFKYLYVGVLEKLKVRTILANTVLDRSYNNCIIKAKASAIIGLPNGLGEDFNCTVRRFAGTTADYAAYGTATISGESDGISFVGKGMNSIFVDGADNFIICGV